MRQLGELASLLDEAQRRETRILAVSTDTRGDSQALLGKLGIAAGSSALELLADPGHRVIDRYGLLNPGMRVAHPAVFVVDREGMVRWSFVETDYTRRAAARDILEALRALRP